jgi:hypothetical protein
MDNYTIKATTQESLSKKHCERQDRKDQQIRRRNVCEFEPAMATFNARTAYPYPWIIEAEEQIGIFF